MLVFLLSAGMLQPGDDRLTSKEERVTANGLRSRPIRSGWCGVRNPSRELIMSRAAIVVEDPYSERYWYCQY